MTFLNYSGQQKRSLPKKLNDFHNIKSRKSELCYELKEVLKSIRVEQRNLNIKFFKIMNKKNKMFVYLFIIGLLAIINGAYLKINGNVNANIVLATGLILKMCSTVGLIINNFGKFKMLLK